MIDILHRHRRIKVRSFGREKQLVLSINIKVIVAVLIPVDLARLIMN